MVIAFVALPFMATVEIGHQGNALAYDGPKKTLGVLTFENRVKGVYGGSEIGDGLTEMLTTELFKTGRFILVERDSLRAVVQEQELGQTGLVRSESAAKVGGLAGAQWLIKGVVSEFDYKSQGGGLGIDIKGFDLGLKTKSAHVAIDIRIIDASTGQIIESVTAKGRADDTGISLGYRPAGKDLGIGTGAFDSTPLGEATREAMQDAIAFIVSKSENLAWTGKIIKVISDTAYINKGASSNLSVGDKLDLYSKGEELIDPDTGFVLGVTEQHVGSITIIAVEEKYSIGRLNLLPGGSSQRGDSVRLSGS